MPGAIPIHRLRERQAQGQAREAEAAQAAAQARAYLASLVQPSLPDRRVLDDLESRMRILRSKHERAIAAATDYEQRAERRERQRVRIAGWLRNLEPQPPIFGR